MNNTDLYDRAQHIRNQLADVIRSLELLKLEVYAPWPEKAVQAILHAKLTEAHEIAVEAMSIGKNGDIHHDWLNQMIKEARMEYLAAVESERRRPSNSR